MSKDDKRRQPLSSWWLTKWQLHYMRKIETWLNKRLDSLKENPEKLSPQKRGDSIDYIKALLKRLPSIDKTTKKLSDEQAQDLLDGFINYYRRNYKTVLASDSEKGIKYIWFTHRSTCISDYSEVLAQARLLLEVIYDAKGEVSQDALIEAFRKSYIKVDKNVSEMLKEDVYQRFKDARSNLLEAKVIERIEESKEVKKKKRSHRFDTSRSLEEATETLRLYIKKSKSTKTKSRLRLMKGVGKDAKKFRDSINSRLQDIKCVNRDSRTLYHWIRCVLLLELSDTDTKKIYQSFVNFFRYHNVKGAVSKVEKGKLYPWDLSIGVWERMLEYFEKSLDYKYELPSDISTDKYAEAVDTLLSTIARGLDDYNPALLSLRFVQSQLMHYSQHPDAGKIIENLFETTLENTYPEQWLDLCLIIPIYLDWLKDNYEGSLQDIAFRFLYILENLQQNQDVIHAKVCVLSQIYQYTEKKARPVVLKNYKTAIENLSSDFEGICSRYWFLVGAYDDLTLDYKLSLFKRTWKDITDLLYKTSNPYCQLYLNRLFHYGLSFIDPNLSLGFTIPLLLFKLYQANKKYEIKNDLLAYDIFPMLSDAIRYLDQPFFQPSFIDA